MEQEEIPVLSPQRGSAQHLAVKGSLKGEFCLLHTSNRQTESSTFQADRGVFDLKGGHRPSRKASLPSWFLGFFCERMEQVKILFSQPIFLECFLFHKREPIFNIHHASYGPLYSPMKPFLTFSMVISKRSVVH